jgi:hypothetical protein
MSTSQTQPGQAAVNNPLSLNHGRDITPVDRKPMPHDLLLSLDVTAAGMCAVGAFEDVPLVVDFRWRS